MKKIILFCFLCISALHSVVAQDTIITIETSGLNRVTLKRLDELIELHTHCNRQLDSLQSEYQMVSSLLHKLAQSDSIGIEILKRFRFSISSAQEENMRELENLRGLMIFDSLNQKNWFFDLSNAEQDSLLIMYVQAKKEVDYARQISAVSRGKCFYVLREIANHIESVCKTRWHTGQQILRTLDQNENLMPCLIMFDNIILHDKQNFILLN